MANKIGNFEIQSELAKSNTGSVYKVTDTESGQVLALKTIRLEAFGEHADDVVERILQEAETTKELSTPNIAPVFGAGEIDGEFCAAMEYVQGNSVATMLARKEGFSVWDLLDISRQVCQGLDHAHERKVYHYSLEPAKIMVTWDGTVKILSFGVSSTGYVNAQAQGDSPSVLYYMSPEQIEGEPLDARSNLFTWGAMLYEMVTDQKAFGGPDADAVRQKILEEMPPRPDKVNPKINAVASNVIMKALAKDPAQRYQSGRELAADLEKCREAVSKGAKKAETPKQPTMAPKVAGAAGKFAGPAAAKPATLAPRAPEPPAAPSFSSSSMADELETSWTPPAATPKPALHPKVETPQPAEARAKAAAASAGIGIGSRGPSLDPSAQFKNAGAQGFSAQTEMQSAAVEDEPEVETPRIAVDPMMAEPDANAARGTSFSEMSELPPLKEVYIAPPPPKPEAAPEATLPSIVFRPGVEEEKPKIDAREVAEKAIKEIKGIPPKLMLYSLGGAVAVVLVIAVAMWWHSHSESTDEEGKVPVAAVSEPAPAAPAAQPQAAPEPSEAAPAAPAAEAPEPAEPAQTSREKSNTAAPAKGKNAKSKKGSGLAAAPGIVAGQLTIDSNPSGAQVQIDGRADSGWMTPYTVTGLAPGAHTIVVSKSGFGQESRTVEIASGGKAAVSITLSQISLMMSVSSDPPGASIIVDGKDTQKVTPSRITLDKGLHTVLVRKTGYLDETTSANGQPGQTLTFAPTLRPLGNVEGIKTVGKLKKLFGGSPVLPGMGKVSVHTTPKGAQVAVNRRMLEKGSPVDFLLDPGNYIIDITATGYKPVQRVITVDKGGSVSIDETLQPN
jgi:serine/threonine-protein kinase